MMRRCSIFSLIIVAFCVGFASACTPEEVELLADDEVEVANSVIMRDSEVLEAGAVQDGRTISLEIVVKADIPPELALELGESYTQLIKIYGPDTATPGREVGKGDYDYNIVVAYPDGTIVGRGVKAKSDTDVEW